MAEIEARLKRLEQAARAVDPPGSRPPSPQTLLEAVRASPHGEHLDELARRQADPDTPPATGTVR